MLCGVFRLSEGPATELEAARRIATRFPEAQALSLGQLALFRDSTAEAAQAEGVHCVFAGRLHGTAGSGAEAMARGYRRSGGEALAELRGSFSVAIWDDVRKQGFLTCDLLATRQWLVWGGAGYLLFATELRDLLAVLPARPGPDPTGFLMWLAGGTCPEGLTLYEGVSRLGPGELLELSPGSATTTVYWRPRYAGTLPGSRAELAASFRQRLERATASRLSAVSNGVVLSGGLDSSIVTTFAAGSLPQGARLRTYSAVFPGAEFDESDKIAALTSALELDPAVFRVEPRGTVRLAVEHTKRWGLPLNGAGALIDMTLVHEAARDGAAVVLDGQTGDEVLGFAPYLVADRLRRGRALAALRLAGRWPIGRATTLRERYLVLRNLGAKGAMPYRLGTWVMRRRSEARGPEWLLPSARRRFAELEDRWAWKVRSSGPLWWRHLSDVMVNAPHRELRLDYLRHRAAAVGLVGESPLYDFDVIDFCLRLPPEIAYDSELARPLAREAVKGLMPEPVRLQRQKADFSQFCADAIAGDDARAFERLLAADDAELGAYVDMDYVRTLWRSDQPGAARGSVSWGSTVWRLAAAECWLRLQTDDSALDALLDSGDAPAPALRPAPL
jgi:asparagine synthase (glutamine-hydrolysing)